MADDATGRESDKFMLRLPDGMRDRLKAEAEANKRSMNAEIVARLEDTLARQETALEKISLDEKETLERLIERIALKLESSHIDHKSSKAFSSDLVFSYRDTHSNETKSAVVEFKRSSSGVDSARRQLKAYARINEAVALGIIVTGDCVISFDPRDGRDINLDDVPDAVRRYKQIMKVDLKDLQRERNKPDSVSGAA